MSANSRSQVGQHRSASAYRLLGLDAFEVVAAEVVDDEWQLEVQTMAEWSAVDVAACELRPMATGRFGCVTCPLAAGRWCCAGASGSGAAMHRLLGADLDRAGGCDRPRAVLTERARTEAARRVGKDAHGSNAPRSLRRVTVAIARRRQPKVGPLAVLGR
jgi:hypothetical protein